MPSCGPTAFVGPIGCCALAIALLIAIILAVLAEIAVNLRVTGDVLQIERFVQLVDSSLASLVLIGAAIAFLVSVEVRIKRQGRLRPYENYGPWPVSWICTNSPKIRNA